MARLLDLAGEEDGESEAAIGGKQPEASVADEDDDDRPNPNVGPFSASLGCYPIISQLAGYIDLNTLHELSRTCRQIRVNLLQYRGLLVEQTLRCENEKADPAARLGDALQASKQIWTAYGRDGRIGRMTSGRVGACARDMVSECRRCSKAVCRNCILKPPPSTAFRSRHRRLCRTCMKAPLDGLTVKTTVPILAEGSNETSTKHIAHSPCSCQEQVWICQPCGQALRSADDNYMRGWAWRDRYSKCGGFGAGLGEANEGVECGRNNSCLAAREVFHERERDEDAFESEMASAEVDSRHWQGSSYTTQEIVGIGGRVKRKVKERVLVGAIVKEYDDKRTKDNFLAREQSGANRSWCSWCERVIVGKKDLERLSGSTDSIASTSSSASG